MLQLVSHDVSHVTPQGAEKPPEDDEDPPEGDADADVAEEGHKHRGEERQSAAENLQEEPRIKRVSSGEAAAHLVVVHVLAEAEVRRSAVQQSQ